MDRQEDQTSASKLVEGLEATEMTGLESAITPGESAVDCRPRRGRGRPRNNFIDKETLSHVQTKRV